MKGSAKRAWDALRNYESQELVRVAFKARHNRELNGGKAREICTSITQARNYLSAAELADQNVRPLLTYYGVLSLARGLILFLTPSLRENGLSQSHGLSIVAWGDELVSPGGDVGNLRIKLNANGTLRELIAATGHESLLRNNSSRPNVSSICRTPPPDISITMLDILSRIPEARSAFMRWRIERNALMIWPQGKQADGSSLLRIDAPYGREDVAAVFGTSATFVTENDGSVLTYSVPGDLTVYLSDVVGSWDIGSLVALRPIAAGTELSKLTMAFVAAYALGMLVRYFPSHWVSMLQNVRHDAALPTLLAILEHVQSDVPQMTLDFIERPKGV